MHDQLLEGLKSFEMGASARELIERPPVSMLPLISQNSKMASQIMSNEEQEAWYQKDKFFKLLHWS